MLEVEVGIGVPSRVSPPCGMDPDRAHKGAQVQLTRCSHRLARYASLLAWMPAAVQPIGEVEIGGHGGCLKHPFFRDTSVAKRLQISRLHFSRAMPAGDGSYLSSTKTVSSVDRLLSPDLGRPRPVLYCLLSGRWREFLYDQVGHKAERKGNCDVGSQ